MPVFSVEPRRKCTSNKTFPGNPVRGLLQWRYRLESTANRDNNQVAAKSKAIGHDELLYVSYIWALIIGKSNRFP